MSAPMADVELLPCPFCGSGKTEIREDRPWLGMRYGEPASVSVRHWCEPIEGQPSRLLERVGRDRAAAVAAWNMRTTAPDWQAPAADGDALREAVKIAYGYLWHVNNEPGTPNQYAPERAAYKARIVLREQLTKDERGEGITVVRAAIQRESGRRG